MSLAVQVGSSSREEPFPCMITTFGWILAVLQRVQPVLIRDSQPQRAVCPARNDRVTVAIQPKVLTILIPKARGDRRQVRHYGDTKAWRTRKEMAGIPLLIRCLHAATGVRRSMTREIRRMGVLEERMSQDRTNHPLFFSNL